YMKHSAVKQRAARHRPAMRRLRIASPRVFDGLRCEAMHCREVLQAAIEPEKRASDTIAKLNCLARYGVEYGFDIGRRTRHDAQDLRSRGLLLQRFAGLIEQAHILDRDHRLVGEGLEQRDL